MALPNTYLSWPVTESGKRWAEHVPDSPVEELRDDGGRAVRTIMTKWETRVDALRDFLGYSKVVTSGATQYLHRHLPHAYPEYVTSDTFRPFLWCTEVQRVEPLGVGPGYGQNNALPPFNLRRDTFHGPIAYYTLAKCQLVYTTLPYEVLPDAEVLGFGGLGLDGFPDEARLLRYVSINPRPSGREIPLPLGSMKYVASADPVTTFPTTAVIEHDWQITWHRVPTAAVGTKLVNPSAASYPLDSCLGCMNSPAFPPNATNQWAIGTLLLTGAQLRPYRSPLGERLWDVTYFIKAFNPGTDALSRAIGHTHLIKPGGREYFQVSTDGTNNLTAPHTAGKSIYNFFDFAKLFRVPA